MRLTAFIVVIFAGLFSTPIAYADDTPTLLRRCGQTDFDLCGFIDAKIWNAEGREVFIIEPRFENAGDFSEGLAAVRVDGNYGYIDQSGQVVIRPQFTYAGLFDQGLAVAGTPEKLGIIDNSGNYVIDPMFSQAVVFNSQVILAQSVENSEYRGVGLHAPFNTSYMYSAFAKAGLYHVRDGWLTEQIYSFDRFDASKRDLLWAQAAGGKLGTFDDLYGLMRANGSWLIVPKYSYATELENNLAPVRIRKNGETLSGAIDGKGREVIPFKFDYLTHWEQGYLKAGKGAYPNRKFGIVNRKGELLADRYFDEIESIDNVIGPDHPKTDYFTVKDGGEWKTLLKDGTLLSDQRIGNIFLECDQFSVYYGAKGYDLRPKDAKLPTVWFEKPSFPYSNRKCNPPPTLIRGETYAAVLENGSVFGGFFENSAGFYGPHRWVSVDKKWGLVNAQGEYAIAPIYDTIKNEKGYGTDNKLPSEKTDATYKVNIGAEQYRLRFRGGAYKQELYSEPEENRSVSLNCKGGYKRKSKNGLWGIVDKNGDDFISPKYRAITCFGSGVAWVPDDSKRQWCPIDKYGQFRPAPPCIAQSYTMWRSHHMPEKFHDDPYESNVLWMRAWLDYGEGRRDEKPKFIPDGTGWGKY